MPNYHVDELLLDTSNPRFEPVTTQREAIAKLVGDGSSKIFALARDIVDQGMLSPADLPCVETSSGTPIVVEGNRRVAALKLLQKPELAPDSETRKEFEKIGASGSYPSTIECAEFATRDDARHWIELRHTGLNGGVGVDPWNATQKARFNGGRETQATRGLQFLDAVKADFSGDAEVMEAYARASQRITNVGRVVSDPDVRRAFGFAIRDNELWWEYSEAATRVATLKLLQELSERKVADFMSKDDRRDWILGLSDHQPKQVDRLDEPVRSGALAASPGKRKTPPGEKPAQGKLGSQQEEKIYEVVRLRHVNARTKQTLVEGQMLKIDKAPYVTGVMLRWADPLR